MTPLDGEPDPKLGRQPVEAALGEPVQQVVQHDAELVTPNELNAWRRGFTPQAEIWNGRLAMLGLSVGLSVLLVARLASH
jgi:hypothetical protein